MTAATTSFTLPDGRTLDVLLGGHAAGLALVMHHGTPSDSTTFSDWDAACSARGLRLIGVSRPGYATSSRLPGRTVAQAVQDTAALLDRLGHDHFLTAGWSGGGPHALACAALLPERCRAAATLAGVGPWGQPDLDFLAGMGPENVAEFHAALEGEAAVRGWLQVNGEAFRQVTGVELAAAFGGLLPAIDQEVLGDGYAEHMAAEMRRALAPGFDGWVDDDLAFTRAWGFELAAIRCPVMVWQGDLDLMVPFAHGRWLAGAVPGARAVLVPGHGHVSLVTRFRDQILDELAAAGRP
jgi:pimeloyl-ACP methyl ester carboxylesterase